MKILINDKMQFSDAPASLKSPALSDTYEGALPLTINFDEEISINCVGIGYTDATYVTLTVGSTVITINIEKDAPYHNGLYIINELVAYEYEYENALILNHDGTYIGRVGVGEYRKLGTKPTKEIGFYTTTESRKTLSGQVIPGAGGYSGRRFEADVPYKITSDIYDDIEAAYVTQIQRLYPYFICTDDEQHKLPANMYYFYAHTDKPLSMLQSEIYAFRYSYKFKFYEAF